VRKNNKLFLRVSAFIIAVIFIIGAVAAGVVTSKYCRASADTNNETVSTSALGMCTMEASTGRVLYEKNADLTLPMASTTKIVTAITVLENCDDIEQVIEIDPRAVGIEGTSIYLQKGEKLSVRELLLGLMLRSGNDASAALAFYICPPAQNTPKAELFNAFSEKMLETAQKAGATNSSFKNPHGLDQEGHYTTARDLALISAYALKNPIFADIVSTKEAKISGVEYPRILRNKNRLLQSTDTCVGVKTGFTKKAGRCYVGASRQNNMTVVCAVLNCGPMFEEAAALMELADKEFTMRRVLTADRFIECDEDEEWNGIARENFFFPLRSEEDVSILCKGDKVCVLFNGEKVYCSEYNKL
jgi:D-alanyl-D-alanine carboxypeptidase (penicillin-binding protein 5/6)